MRKLGAPWLNGPSSVRRVDNRPPAPRPLSTMLTRQPCARNSRAAVVPHTPAPTTKSFEALTFHHYSTKLIIDSRSELRLLYLVIQTA